MAVTKRKDSPITGRMAKWYDATTRHDMAAFVELGQRLAKQLPEGAKVLEVAPGPGFLAIELAKRNNIVTGLDLSQDLVDLARANARDAGVRVDFRQGNAAAMPLPSNAYDFIVCRAAFKNFGQPVEALNEMHRVLKPGGQALIIDLRNDVSMDEINQYVDQSGRSGFDAFATKLAFRHLLIRRAYTKADFEQMISASSFEQFQIERDDIGYNVWLTK